MGWAFSGAFVSALRTQAAAQSRSEKSLALASPQGYPGFPAEAKQMRQISGPRGRAAHQDVLVAADMEEADIGAWVAHRKTKKKVEKKKKGGRRSEEAKNKVTGDGQNLSGFNHRAGISKCSRPLGPKVHYALLPRRPPLPKVHFPQ